MKYLFFTALVGVIFTQNVLAKSLSVFMVEDEKSKHIALMTEDGDYKLITYGDQWHLYPNISPDGNRVVYAKGDDANSLSLYLHDLRTGRIERLTDPGFVVHPSFAKAGKRIYFSIKVNTTQKIAYMDLNGSREIHYINEEMPAFFPKAFQNAERLIYQRNNGKVREIVLYDVKADKKEVIAKGMSPSLSKDEKLIAFTALENDNWDIFIYDRFNKTIQRVTSNAARDFSPHFNNAGDLLYTNDQVNEGTFGLYLKKKENLTNTQIEGIEVLQSSDKSFYAPQTSGQTQFSNNLLDRMIGDARSSFGAIEYEGKIYVVGGHKGAEHTYPPESFSGEVNIYDINLNRWKKAAPRPSKAHGFQLAAYNGYIYAFGGFAYEENNLPKWKSLNLVERYNIAQDKWEYVNLMPRKRSSNVAVQIDHYVYLIGGWDSTPRFDDDIDGTFHDQIDRFDLRTHQWLTLRAKLPKKRRAFSAFVRNGLIYLLGGISEGGSHFSLSDDFTQFDPLIGNFKELPKLPFGTFAPAAGRLSDYGLMFGGMFKTGQWDYEYVPHIYQFNFNEMKWTHTGRFLNEYKGFSQVVGFEDCLGILGGHSYDGQTDAPLKTFEKFCIERK
tara:strand:- start:196015 stop:197847 length:1833 start_codon:yes stop_codon:yes gene_type:complete